MANAELEQQKPFQGREGIADAKRLKVLLAGGALEWRMRN